MVCVLNRINCLAIDMMVYSIQIGLNTCSKHFIYTYHHLGLGFDYSVHSLLPDNCIFELWASYSTLFVDSWFETRVWFFQHYFSRLAWNGLYYPFITLFESYQHFQWNQIFLLRVKHRITYFLVPLPCLHLHRRNQEWCWMQSRIRSLWPSSLEIKLCSR